MLKALLLMGLGLGLTWAAGQLTGGRPPAAGEQRLVQADGDQLPPAPGDPTAEAGAGATGGDGVPATEPVAGEGAGDGTGDVAGGGAEPAAVEDVSAEDLEAEIRALEQAVSQAPSRDPGEVAADKPLSADLGVSLPSDI